MLIALHFVKIDDQPTVHLFLTTHLIMLVRFSKIDTRGGKSPDLRRMVLQASAVDFFDVHTSIVKK